MNSNEWSGMYNRYKWGRVNNMCGLNHMRWVNNWYSLDNWMNAVNNWNSFHDWVNWVNNWNSLDNWDNWNSLDNWHNWNSFDNWHNWNSFDNWNSVHCWRGMRLYCSMAGNSVGGDHSSVDVGNSQKSDKGNLKINKNILKLILKVQFIIVRKFQ